MPQSKVRVPKEQWEQKMGWVRPARALEGRQTRGQEINNNLGVRARAPRAGVSSAGRVVVASCGQQVQRAVGQRGVCVTLMG